MELRNLHSSETFSYTHPTALIFMFFISINFPFTNYLLVCYMYFYKLVLQKILKDNKQFRVLVYTFQLSNFSTEREMNWETRNSISKNKYTLHSLAILISSSSPSMTRVRWIRINKVKHIYCLVLLQTNFVYVSNSFVYQGRPYFFISYNLFLQLNDLTQTSTRRFTQNCLSYQVSIAQDTFLRQQSSVNHPDEGPDLGLACKVETLSQTCKVHTQKALECSIES